jgi:hypothetical protein
MMLRNTVSRIRLFATVLGCAVLGVSLLSWALTLQATEAGYTWVGADSHAPAVETAEIWQASASCERPFFVKAVLQSKARLQAYYDLAPKEVRAWRDRPIQRESLQPSLDQSGLYRLVNSEQGGLQRNVAAEMERGATLHAKYAEWFATASNLDTQANQWEQRLSNVADQRVTFGEATRNSFRAYSDPDIKPAATTSGFEHYVLFMLGLGGFSNDDEQALKANCVNVIPVKKIFKDTSYFRGIWRWPVDHVAAFSLGLELVLIGMLFVPIAIWINTGDSRTAKQYVRDAADRFVAKAMNFHKSKFVVDLLSTSSAILAGIRTFLTAPINPDPAGGEIRFG